MGRRSPSTMVKEYARAPTDAATSCKAKGSDLRVHFKNTRETTMAIKNMSLEKAKKYLEDVVDKKRAVPFRRYCGGVGRTSQACPAGSTTGQRSLVNSCLASSATPRPTLRSRTWRSTSFS